MDYSHYQQTIFEFVKSRISGFYKGKRHGVVMAGPGCAKTTTMVASMEYIPEGIPTILASFGKDIATVLQNKVPPYIESRTLNSFGWQVCRQNVRSIKMDKWKTQNILKTFIEDENIFFKLRNPVSRIISLLKNNLVLPDDKLIITINEIIDYHALGLPDLNINIPSLVRDIYLRGLEVVDKMDFDDQKLFPIICNWKIPHYKFVGIDESQDLCNVEIELVERMLGDDGHALFVGDEYQCQPIGTMVAIVQDNKIVEIPIEEITKGETVVSWNKNDRQWRQTKKVLQTGVRDYLGQLITVQTQSGYVSRYTPNHKCVVNFEALIGNYGVYLMLKDDQFRVGMTFLSSCSSANGLRSRLNAENADSIWLLSLHAQRKDAYLEKQYVSCHYALPQMIFNVSNESVLTQTDINYFWSKVGSNYASGVEALIAHGRDIKFPLFTKIDPLWKNGLRRPMITQACNLMDGCLILPYNHFHKSHEGHSWLKEWEQIKVTTEWYDGKVYSLSIQDNETYVADHILTANSVYLFKGADSDSMQNIITRFDAEVMPLPICYRCPDAVIEEAQKINPLLEKPEPNKKGKGVVESITKDVFREQVEEGDYVLCRTTAPLIKECLRLLPTMYCYVKGREIGDGLNNLIKNIIGKNDLSLEVFEQQMEMYYSNQLQRLKNKKEQLSMLEDQIDSIRALIPKCDTVNDLVNLIDELIPANEEQGGVVFMTAHKSKGLEGKNIYLLRRDLIPHKRAVHPWQIKQETHLLFVAITRAEHSFRYVLKERDER